MPVAPPVKLPPVRSHLHLPSGSAPVYKVTLMSAFASSFVFIFSPSSALLTQFALIPQCDFGTLTGTEGGMDLFWGGEVE